MQVYNESGLGNRHASAMELDDYSKDLAGKKNMSASHASTATGLAMFAGAEHGAQNCLYVWFLL
jgi:hypothetical protein